MNEPTAFLSYTHFDDQNDSDRITKIARLLASEVRAQTGAEFHIFHDRSDIKVGEAWEHSITTNLAAATFLIPVITPGYFTSNACRDELTRFLELEKQTSRPNRILPAKYIETPALRDRASAERDDLVSAVARRQFMDWTRLRHDPVDAPSARRILERLAQQIRDRLTELSHAAPGKDADGGVGPDGPLTTETTATVTHFAPAPDERYNKSFYEYFSNRLGDAQHGIYITGEGFELSTSEGRAMAEGLLASLRRALANGAMVVRVQTRRQANPEWAMRLGELVDEYPDNFDLYVLRDRAVAQMSSVCVIDPDHPTRNVVEIMLSTQRLFGVTPADLAGTAVFIEDSPDLALDLRRRIVSLTATELSHHPTSSAETVAVMVGTQYYFAYGSNMAADQMTKRVASAKLVGIGVLRGHELVFSRRGSYRYGGVASVETTDRPEDKVYGVIWEVDHADFAILDEVEDPDAYRRSPVTVTTVDGERFHCYLYEAIPQGKFAPDPDYLRLIIAAAVEAGLPDEYIEYLRGLLGE
jgi:gamma-glutamylcyclotransferase (GGCT)/AIG2-like uncharacterized protein YtfP